MHFSNPPDRASINGCDACGTDLIRSSCKGNLSCFCYLLHFASYHFTTSTPSITHAASVSVFKPSAYCTVYPYKPPYFTVLILCLMTHLEGPMREILFQLASLSPPPTVPFCNNIWQTLSMQTKQHGLGLFSGPWPSFIC
jgi:hypothetical protein